MLARVTVEPALQQVRALVAPEQPVGPQPHCRVGDRQPAPHARDSGGQRHHVLVVEQRKPDQDIDVMVDAVHEEAGPGGIAGLAGGGGCDGQARDVRQGSLDGLRRGVGGYVPVPYCVHKPKRREQSGAADSDHGVVRLQRRDDGRDDRQRRRQDGSHTVIVAAVRSGARDRIGRGRKPFRVLGWLLIRCGRPWPGRTRPRACR